MADDLLTQARKAFQRCADAESENRTTALEDIRFARLGEQWPEEIRKLRTAENRPMHTINTMPAYIRQVVNDCRQNKPQINVHPVDSAADPKTADVLSGLVRNIESISNADVAYDTVVDQAATGGFGYIRVSIDYAYDTAFDLEVLIERISNQFSVYGDPNSTAADSSDWDVCFVTDRLSEEQYKLRYPGQANVSFDSAAWKTAGDDWHNGDGVLIAEWWQRKEEDREIVMLDDGRVFRLDDIENDPDLATALETGERQIVNRRKIKAKIVTQTIISGAAVLQEAKEFPGCYIPIIPCYGEEIIVEGKRYFRGLIHNAKDAQMVKNFWRTQATELVALAPRVPWIGRKGTFDSDERWGTANTESHSFLEYDNEAPQRQMLDSGVAAGALQEALNASDDVKSIIGLHDASLGARSNETSGKAIMARQREGDVSTFHFIDNLARCIRHVGKVVIGIIPTVYASRQVLRILGEDGTVKNIPQKQQYMADQSGNPIEAPETNGPDTEGEIQKAIVAMHDLSVGKYDVTVTSGPSFTTRRQESAEQMMVLIQSYPAIAPVIGDIFVRALDWPGADEIAKRIEEERAKAQGQGGIPPELQQQMQEGMQRIQQLEAENLALKASKEADMANILVDQEKVKIDAIKADIERQKAATAQYEAETARMQALAATHPIARADTLNAMRAA